MARPKSLFTIDAIPYVAAVVGILIPTADLFHLGWQLSTAQPATPLLSLGWYLIVLNAVFLVGITAFVSANRNLAKRLRLLQVSSVTRENILRDQRNSQSEIARSLKNISVERISITKYLIDVLSGNSAFDEASVNKIRRFLQITLNHVNDIFELYTTHKCSSSIKLFLGFDPFDVSENTLSDEDSSNESSKINEAQNVYTCLRNDSSRADRQGPDVDYLKSYPYDKNAAFFYIMSDPSKDDYFFSNDLIEMEKRDLNKYWNENEKWQSFYNATAVVPIKHPEKNIGGGTLGFICIDNKNGGFDDGYCKYTLELLSNTNYDVLETVFIIRQLTRNRQPEGERST